MAEIDVTDFLAPDSSENDLKKEAESQTDAEMKEMKMAKVKNIQKERRGLFEDENGEQLFNPLVFIAYFLTRVVMFCVGEDSYFAYNNCRHMYQKISIRTVKKLARKICDEAETGIYTIYIGDKVFKALIETVPEHESLVQTQGVIVFRNGTLYLNLTEEQPMKFVEKFSSKNIVFQALPYDYNPDAECPKFKKFLSECMKKDRDLIHLLLDCLSNIFIFGETYVHHICYFYGVGRNGKSVLLECLSKYIFPDMCSHLAIDKLNDRFGSSALVDKVMNVFPEAEAKVINTEVIKMISAGDTITAEFKYKNSFSIRITAKLFVSTNKLPYADDFSKGWSDRLTIIPFEQVFEVPPLDDADRKDGVMYQNPHLLEELAGETEGIAGLLLKNLKKLKKRKWVLTASKTAEATKQRALLEANPVLLFFNSCIDVYPSKDRKQLRTSHLHRSFKIWAERNEVEIGRFYGATAFHKAFRNILKMNGCASEPKQVRGNQYYKDIDLKVDYGNIVNYN